MLKKNKWFVLATFVFFQFCAHAQSNAKSSYDCVFSVAQPDGNSQVVIPFSLSVSKGVNSKYDAGLSFNGWGYDLSLHINFERQDAVLAYTVSYRNYYDAKQKRSFSDKRRQNIDSPIFPNGPVFTAKNSITKDSFTLSCTQN